jgi:hypothetical protein
MFDSSSTSSNVFPLLTVTFIWLCEDFIQGIALPGHFHSVLTADQNAYPSPRPL